MTPATRTPTRARGSARTATDPHAFCRGTGAAGVTLRSLSRVNAWKFRQTEEREMSEWHPDRDQLERFLEDEMRGEESRELQRHLFSCAACEERMIALLPGWTAATSTAPSPETGEEEYRGLLKRVLADNRAEMEKRGSRLTRERAEAGPLLGELIALPPGRRAARVREGVRFHSWGLFELLVERARKDIFEDPRGAESSLAAAVEIADHLDPRRYGPGS